MRNPTRVLLCALVLGALFSGCNNNTAPALPAEGTYSGFYDNQEITATLTHVSDSEIQIALSNPFNETWDAKWSGSDSVELTKPSDSEKLSSTKDSPDLFTAKVGDDTYQLTWSSDEIHWGEAGPDNARVAALDLTRLLTDAMPTLEAPQSYTLAELMDRAKSHNFESVVEFQKVMIAKYTAVNAEMNLLPHGNTTDLFNIMSLSLFTGLKSIGDLAPFVLPSRWIRVAGEKDLLASEQDAWTIMDLDGMNYVESFSYEMGRDAESMEAIRLERTMIESLRDIVRGKERVGGAPIGASDPLSSLLNKIDLTLSSLDATQQTDSAALGLAAGFYNPKAVTSVTLPQDPDAPSVGHPLAVDFETSAKLVVSVSVELRQLDDLMNWAKTEKDARYFDWLDPSGNTNGGVGVGLPSYIEAAQSQVDQIAAQKQEKTATLLNQLQDVLTQLQKNVDDYNNAILGSEIQERRVLRQTENLKIGNDFDMNELVAALQDQVNSQLAQIDAEYGYLLALSRYNRLLYQGAYAVEGGSSTWSGSH